VVAAVLVASLASMTLVPAMLAMIGPAAFWPNRRRKSAADLVQPKPSRFWSALASLVIRRPTPVMVISLLVLILPALRGASMNWNYDSLFSLKPTYQARMGTHIVQRHWPIGETAPVTLLAVSQDWRTADAWKSACGGILQVVRTVRDVGDIRALTSPLGLRLGAAQNLTMQLLLGDQIKAEFLSADQKAMRPSVVLGEPPLTRTAMEDVANIQAAANRAMASSPIHATVYVAGATAEMTDIKSVTQADFRRVAERSLVVILVMLTIVLRDGLMAVFIVAATVLSYLTTLGLTYWVFRFFGGNGLEWKVQMLLFVVLVAVGQDYSLFFAVRFAQEARLLPCAQATERALIFTGPVISSCGLIMAATLGSIMAGDITLLVQLGFAFALGMLIDTFIVRPLLLPAFMVLTKRTLGKAMAFG
jgi:RND superfamily putative drug exporter